MPQAQKSSTVILILVFFFLAACSFPALGAPTEPSIDPVLTDAARTIEARLTSEAGSSQPTATLGWVEFSPTPPLDETPSPSENTPIPAETIPPTVESSCEDRTHFVSDVNYPDGTEVEAGVEFTKTWRLQNTGTCTWNSDYAIVFERGDAMEASPSTPFSADPVPPQGEVEVSVAMKSPDAPGTYQGYWRLRDKAGLKFGTGEKNIKLENRSEAGVTLITHPKHVDHGSIFGTFPEYTVKNGDHFKSKLGFLDDCGEGDVLFQLWYQVDQVQNKLAEWSDSCNGNLVFVDTDLSNIVGEKVQFVLVVSANGSPVDDLAIWGSTRIER